LLKFIIMGDMLFFYVWTVNMSSVEAQTLNVFIVSKSFLRIFIKKKKSIRLIKFVSIVS
jgi:hypothetical protein